MNTSYSFIDYSIFYYQKNRICGIFVNVFLLNSDLKSMVNSSAFQGTHRDFLLSQKARYVAGVVGGYTTDALAGIQRRYFKCYLINLAHSEEPVKVQKSDQTGD